VDLYNHNPNLPGERGILSVDKSLINSQEKTERESDMRIPLSMTLRVGIAGLGRIGRGLLRTNYTQSAGGRFDMCVVCDVMPIDQVAYLMAHDSTYGKPAFSLDCDGRDLIIGGKNVRYLQIDRRRGLPDEDVRKALRKFELDVFIDATGTATIADLRAIIEQKIAKKVICTLNIGGCDITLVFGVNDHDYDPEGIMLLWRAPVPEMPWSRWLLFLISTSVSTTRIITIHPARVLDGYHAVSQLGRTCAASILPVSTNVAKSTALVLPSLEGKLDSISYRIPTAIVSVLDFTATLARNTSRDECVELFENYAKTSLAGIIHCEYGAWGHEKASIDFLGTEFSSIILMNYLVVSNGKHLGISLMHDNERAYCCRALDIWA
jgi:glyceraldehyde 3-phosphate dehydrogenase